MEERENPSFLSFSFPPSLGMRSSRCAGVVAPEGIGRMSEGEEGGREEGEMALPSSWAIDPSLFHFYFNRRRPPRAEGGGNAAPT